jgi:hypothetical protein
MWSLSRMGEAECRVPYTNIGVNLLSKEANVETRPNKFLLWLLGYSEPRNEATAWIIGGTRECGGTAMINFHLLDCRMLYRM